MLVANARLPIFQQHGDKDDNVPAFHSRRMHQVLREAGWKSQYSELVGKGHWFDGVMTTNELKEFYEKNAAKHKDPVSSTGAFNIIVANPGSQSPIKWHTGSSADGSRPIWNCPRGYGGRVGISLIVKCREYSV